MNKKILAATDHLVRGTTIGEAIRSSLKMMDAFSMHSNATINLSKSMQNIGIGNAIIKRNSELLRFSRQGRPNLNITQKFAQSGFNCQPKFNSTMRGFKHSKSLIALYSLPTVGFRLIQKSMMTEMCQLGSSLKSLSEMSAFAGFPGIARTFHMPQFVALAESMRRSMQAFRPLSDVALARLEDERIANLILELGFIPHVFPVMANETD